VDIRWLQDFLTVAETGNFTRAAQLRNVSQAAFSRRIKSLELWLGAALIDRTSFPTRLTPRWRAFRERAAEIVAQVAETKSSLTSTVVPRRNQIRIALPTRSSQDGCLSGGTPGRRRPGRVSCGVWKAATCMRLSRLSYWKYRLAHLLRNVHAAIILPSDRYDHISIGKELFAPYASSTSVAQKRSVFPGRKGAPLPLLMYSKNAIFAREVDAIIENAPQKLVAHTVLETETAEVLEAMAAADHGVAWLPECVAKRAPSGVLARVDASDWSTHLGIVAYRDKNTGCAAMERLWSPLSSGKV